MSTAIKILAIVLFSICSVFTQTNSVVLKDSVGTVLSQHNSISAAYSSIPSTIAQKYIIEILTPYDGSTETFPIQLTAKIGSSAVNTITIRPAAGNTGEIITGTVTNNQIINIDDADYLIIDGRPGGAGTSPDLTINNPATSGSNSHTIRLINGACNNVIKYCVLINGTANTAGPRNIEIGTSISNISGNSNNLISNCKINGGRSGIGFSGTAINLNANNMVEKCEIFNFGYAAIWMLSNTRSTVIEDCLMYQTQGVNSSIVFGINCSASGMQGTNFFRKNKIYDLISTSTSTSLTIRGIYVTSPNASTVNIENNFISLALDNAQSINYGIQVYGTGDNTVNIFYNSIRIAGNHTGGTSTSLGSACIYKNSTGDTALYVQKNNICINNRTGGSPIHVAGMIETTSAVEIDYNTYYSTGSGSFHAGWGTNYYTNLADYKTAASPNESHSKFYNAQFVSLTDLHLTGTSNGDTTLAGIPIVGISTDIDGNNRHISKPYMGADEAPIPLPVELSSFFATVNGNMISLFWTTSSEKNNLGFEVERQFNNHEWVKIGFINGNGSSLNSNEYNFADRNLSIGKYSYRIKQVDYSGTFKYFYLNESFEIVNPIEFKLYQNYPNPFNPITNINFNLPEDSKVVLKIYNVIGKEIITFQYEELKVGSHSLQFDASNLPSGIYYYKLSVGSFTAIKAMVLIK
jgi:hypothetical protein